MRAVLFDMDGVIVDSERYWVELESEQIFPAALASATVSPSETTGMNYREIYDYLEDRHEMAVEKDGFIQLFDEAAEELYGERVALMDGLPELLTTLHERGLKLAVVSSSPPSWIGTVLDRFGIRDDFDLIVSADELTVAGKPEPDVFLHAAAELGVDPEECVIVEDSAHGVQAGKAAGAYVIGYQNQSEGEQDISAADEIVETPESLRESVLALTS